MKTNTILPVKEGDFLVGLRGFLSTLLENQIVDALLVPLEIAQGRSLAQTLVQDPAYLGGANPFSPVMAVNSATLVSQLTGDKPSQKVGVVLRSCEIRALTELVKLQQANLDNLTIIGVDCLGTHEVDDYARLIGEMEGPAEEKGAQVVAEMRQRIEEGSAEASAVPLRMACQICEFPTPVGADITVGLIGVEDGILVTLDSELVSKLGLAEGEAPQREEAVAKLVEARTAARDQAFAEFREAAKSIADFADQFATCIRCYTCSVACPICFCKECVFRTETFEPESERYFQGMRRKGALRMPSETLLYQLTRLNHMVASCVGCGMCESACPSNLPLTVIFRSVGSGVQEMLNYTPGRSLEDELPPLAIFREGELVMS
ncbi:MAG: Coenzyme F420 hydrogenase/dehydrogenase, beta subunit C-terminal domain [Anaerolineae bacterium]|nr:Coenzyme F420 hydrogenase/dehydrogenase, beta subunit C-terminal domain [Anaerolineae bacterium]